MMQDDVGLKAGRNLRKAMEAAGVTAADITKALGVSHQTVGNWKNRGVSAKYAPYLAEWLGTQPELISPALASGSRQPGRAPPPRDEGEVMTSYIAPPPPPRTLPPETDPLERVYAALDRARLSDDDAVLLELMIRSLSRR